MTERPPFSEEDRNWKIPDEKDSASVSPIERKDNARDNINQKLRRALTLSFALLVGAGVFRYKEVDEIRQEQIAKILQEVPTNSLEQRSLEMNRAFLVDTYGEEILKKLAEATLENKESTQPKTPPEIKGFQQYNISNDFLRKLWLNDSHYPRTWMNGQIEEISPERKIIGRSQTKEDTKDAKGYVGQTYDKHEIHFVNMDDWFHDNQGSPAESELDWVFTHELGHANDWIRHESASFANRVELLARTTQLLEKTRDSEKWFIADYEERTKGMNDGPEKTYAQASEFFADMSMMYLQSSLEPEMYDVVDDWVRQDNPNFEADEAAKKRKQVITEYRMTADSDSNQTKYE